MSKFAAGSKELKFHLGSPGEQPSASQPSGSQQSAAGNKGKKGKKPVKEGPEPARDGYINVYDFFQRTHGITITDPSMPVVNVSTRQKPSYMPPDVCVVLPGQPSDAKLTPNVISLHLLHFVLREETDFHDVRVQGIEVIREEIWKLNEIINNGI